MFLNRVFQFCPKKSAFLPCDGQLDETPDLAVAFASGTVDFALGGALSTVQLAMTVL